LEFIREKERDVHKNVGNRFKQFGIGNVDDGEKMAALESPNKDEAWPAPFVLVQRFKTDILPQERQQLKNHFVKIK